MHWSFTQGLAIAIYECYISWFGFVKIAANLNRVTDHLLWSAPAKCKSTLTAINTYELAADWKKIVAAAAREREDNGLFITLVPKVL